jgi:hypothetical protein
MVNKDPSKVVYVVPSLYFGFNGGMEFDRDARQHILYVFFLGGVVTVDESLYSIVEILDEELVRRHQSIVRYVDT